MSWKIKKWKFPKNATENQIEQKLNEMIEWCNKHDDKYQIRSILACNCWAVEYRPLIKIL